LNFLDTKLGQTGLGLFKAFFNVSVNTRTVSISYK